MDPPRPPVPPRSAPAGFTLVEMMAVLVLMGILVAIAQPRLDFAGYRSSGAMQFVGTTLLAAQRAAITRQHNVVVAFDAATHTLRLHYDRDNDGVMDTGEEVRREPLGEGVVYGRGTAAAAFVGNGPITFVHRQAGLPAVTFHRNGSANEEGGVYLTTRRAVAGSFPRDARLVVVDRATGRASWLAYTGSTWKREF